MYDVQLNPEAILASLSDVIFLIDEHKKVVNLWTSEEELLSLPPKEIPGKLLDEVFSKQYAEVLSQNLDKAYKAKSIQNFEFKNRETHRWFGNRISFIETEGADSVKLAVVQVRDISRNKQIEERLKEAQEFANLASWYTVFETNMVEWSPEVYKIFGLDPNNEPPKFTEYFNYVHTEDVAHVRQKLQECLEEGQATFLQRIFRPDGEMRHIKSTVKPLLDHEGKAMGVYGSTLDVTDIFVTRQKMKEESERLSLAKEAMGIGIWDWDILNNQLRWDNSMYKLFGVKKEDFEGEYEAYEKCLHPDDAEQTNKDVEAAINGDTIKFNQTFRIIRPDNDVRYIAADSKVIRDENGKGIRMYGMNWDVTDKVLGERELAQSEAKYRTVVNNVQEVIFQADIDGNWTFLNDSWEEITGYKLEESLGQKMENFVDEYDCETLTVNYHNIITKETPEFKQTIRMLDKNGDYRWIEFYARHMLDEKLNITGTTGTLYDVTDRVKTAEELTTARDLAEKASRSKAEFLSTMSHEIRTPMNAVIGMTHLLLMEDPKENQVDNLKTLKFSAENLLVLINDILDFSKIDAGKIDFEQVPTNIGSLLKSIKNANQHKAEEKNISLKLKMDSEMPDTVLTDPTRLSQVINNLVSNAVKFTKEGSVTVDVSVEKLTDKNASILFSVIDTGIGIPENKLDSIFESFSQANPSTTREFGGTGLGLAITKKLLQLMDSDIKVSSTTGKGSTFEFKLDFELGDFARPTQLHDHSTQKYESLDGVHVLLVEDNEINIKLAQKFLDKWDLEVSVARNGEEALDMLTENEYDIILMDLQMPIMDGYKATEEIKRRKIKTPVIALTASAMLDVQDRAFKAGMDDYITKPFNPAELYRKIVKYCVE